jgi:acetyltransferase-like isoleucine patch superfamily enzyme
MIAFVRRARYALLVRWWNAVGTALLRAQGVRVAGDLTLYGFPIVTGVENACIEIGERVVLCSDSRFTALGIARPVIIRALAPGATILIGRDTGISGAVICAACSIEIGAECLLGADVQVVDNDFHSIAAEGRRYSVAPPTADKVVIEDNVFLGAGVRVLKGVRIGRNSVVGAGSVVTKNIPSDSIAAGNPARVLASLMQRHAGGIR